MSTIFLFIFSLGSFLFLILISPCCAKTNSENQLSCETLTFFYELWRDSAFGNHPNGVERAGWILKNPDGQLTFEKWRNSDERNKDVWKGPAPSNRAGVIHTHPVQRDPKPSPADGNFAKQFNIPVYVVSEKGIWMSTPEGKKSRVMNYLLFKEEVMTCRSSAKNETRSSNSVNFKSINQ